MKKVYLYKRFERFWHWGQTILILLLIFTGFEIHGTTDFIGYASAVKIHNTTAWIFMILIVFAVFWHITTDEWKHYLPTIKNMRAQIDYYITGIFTHAPHPTKKRTLSKLNPLQRITYFALKILLIPIMVITGLLYMYFNYPLPGFEMNSLETIAIIHTFVAYLLLTFLIIHLYLITTGHTVTSNLNAMITGWEIVDDDEVKDIVMEAVEEAGMKIKPVDDEEYNSGHQKIKNLVIEALKETEEKVDKKELRGQEGDHYKHEITNPKSNIKKKKKL
ncbi:MAG: cytochrome b/b6 domain-containing protein [Bacteroidetes bacterium]|nr:cytochrome b/b6 domain-containing protein [Bacteroidota bacterium]